MIFLDTSAFYAMEVKRDINHERAISVKKEIAGNKYGMPVTTNLVIVEAITLLRLKAGHSEAVAFGEKVFASRSLKTIRVGEDIERKALELFKKHSDKRLSFTDCISFAIMDELKISKAFAFDDHFKHLGYETI
jgi:hypothetical protein